jgi:CubicO group peptidase (beta-lactamase class C family)
MEIGQPEALGFSPARLARIRSTMQGLIDEGKLASVLTLIARYGKVVHCESVGARDLETGKPMAEDTICRMYSMSKPITTVAVMMLYEEGRFRLHDPIHLYLPEFKDVQVAEIGVDGQARLVVPVRPITIHDLLTHTAGLSYGWEENNLTDKLFRERVEPLWKGRGKTALRDFVHAVAGLPLYHQPGQIFHYSVAIDVLGYLVEVVSGMPFGDFLRQRIFEPMGMVDTSFWVPEDKRERFAKMYGPLMENGTPVPGKLTDIDPLESSSYCQPDRLPSGGGGLVSTASDYLRFCQMFLNHGELDGVRLLGRKTIELMHMNHLPKGQYSDDERASGFGLGGFVMLDPARSTANSSIGSWGWAGAATTWFSIDFQEQMIAIMMIQYQPGSFEMMDKFGNLVYQAMI